MNTCRWSVPFLLTPTLLAQVPATVAAPSLPVREVTAFKDGHAYVVREAPLPADANGRVVVEDLPAPVLGTFWPYAGGGARLVSAKAGHEKVARDVVAADFRQIARANLDKDVVVVTGDKERIEGRLVAVPSRSPEPNANDGELLLLKTATGTRAVPLAQVRDLEVRGEFAATLRGEEQRDQLVLQIAGGGQGATVGLMYVQQGLRWIPAYRVDIDGAGKASVQFEATLQNDLIDLDHATVNLVIGVPEFAFAGMVDPISLQQEMAQVSANMVGRRAAQSMLSNAIMTQVADFRQEGGGEAQPEVEGSTAAEDLFVFTVRDVTLKKGERLVLPITSYALTYRDVYRLDVPFAPPMEVRQNLQSERVFALARELAAPKARHLLRLQNGDQAPLTTAPALVLEQGRVLAQGRMSYTPKGGESDLEINVAVDLRVDLDEHETKRDPGPFRFGNDNFARVDLAGAIDLKNHKPVPVEIEVTRRVLGLADDVGQDGSKRQLGLLELGQGPSQPAWWGWWSWPYWWFARNGFAEYRWQVKLAPGASARLDASWHYFWQ